ncbi:MAG: PDDEXK nuclease domain-containing protein [Armatimonadota bacterium]
MTSNKSTSVVPQDYATVQGEIKERIRIAQYDALKAVNHELVSLYWDIGRIIAERQQEDSWGKAIVETLARDLQTEFPGLAGFSSRNLWRMRDFYSTYHQNAKLPPLVAEISWSHNILIIEKCKDDQEREFYLRAVRKYGWSKSTLQEQIATDAFRRFLTGQTNFDQTLPAKLQQQTRLVVKDEYAFGFLGLGEEFSERQLEAAILLRVGPFLREMGGMFAFIGNQYRLEVGEQEFFIDLLLYHRRLKCLVAIELKIGDFLPEYVGKMQFYLAALDDLVREKDERLSIGIILCKTKDRTVVEYALRESNKPIGVATYRTVKTLPAELRRELPAPEQVAMLLEGMG